MHITSTISILKETNAWWHQKLFKTHIKSKNDFRVKIMTLKLLKILKRHGCFSNGIFDVLFKHKQRQRIILETEILLRSLSPNEPPRLAKKASKFQEKKTPLKG